MKKKLLLPALLTFYAFTAFSQTLKYDIILLGKKIGETVVEKKDSAGFITYSIVSHSDAHILGMVRKDAMHSQAIFRGDKMLSSSYEDEKKNRKTEVHTQWNKDKLDVEVNGKMSFLSEPASTSSLSLYFAEPGANEKIFSERLGQFVEIAKEKEGKYKIAFNDYTAIYTYVEGKIKELQMKEDAGQVVMRLVE